jgi:hypothetical protein
MRVQGAAEGAGAARLARPLLDKCSGSQSLRKKTGGIGVVRERRGVGVKG